MSGNNRNGHGACIRSYFASAARIRSYLCSMSVNTLTERKTSVTRKKSAHAGIASAPSVLSVLSVYFVVANYSRGLLSIRGSKGL
jgi:hypothetical protein